MVVVNPLTAQWSKRSHLRKVKTDAQDAYHLAELFYKEEFSPSQPKQDSLSRLRLLTRHHEAMTTAYVQLKLQFQAILDQVFPLYPGVFSDLFCKTCLKMLHRYPTPSAVLEAGEEKLITEIHSLTACSRSEAWAQEKAKKMMTAAQNSPVLAICESHRVLVREMMELLSRHQEHLKQIETEMEAVARDIHEYDSIRSIPGVGDKIAATILSEVGEVDRFGPSPDWIPVFTFPESLSRPQTTSPNEGPNSCEGQCFSLSNVVFVENETAVYANSTTEKGWKANCIRWQ